MTAAAFAPVSSGAPKSSVPPASPGLQVTEALFEAQHSTSTQTAIYVIGGGALTTLSLLAMAAAEAFAPALRWPSAGVAVLALLWLVVGGKFIHRQHQQLHACTARYDAHMQRQMYLRLARQSRASVSADALVHLPRRPISLFGAYL